MKSSPSSGEEKGWIDLVGLDPTDVCRRSLASYKSKTYTLEILTSTYNILMNERIITPLKDQTTNLPEFGVDFRIMVLDYLLNSKDIPISGKLVSGAQLKTGEFFFRGTHGLNLEGLIEEFGKEPERFKQTGMSLGCTVTKLGDVSIQLMTLPRVPITYVLWTADDEFPARISVLFDSTADSHMHLDTLRSAVIITNKSLLALRA